MRVYKANKGGEDSFIQGFSSYVKGVNHRGYATVAPENTLPAYQLSAKKGFRYVETDVLFTSDNVPVLLHDITIDRTSNGTGNIYDLTLAQVRQYDFGSWKSSAYAGTKIPTFEEFLILCRNLGLHPYIEIKSGGYIFTQAQINMLVDMVNSFGLRGNATFISFQKDYLRLYVKERDPYARIGYVVNSVDATKISEAQAMLSGNNEVFLNTGSSSISSTEVALCKEAGLPLETWGNFSNPNKQWVLDMDNYVSGVTNDSLNAEYVLYEKSLG